MNLFKKRKMNKITLFLFSVCFLSLSLYTNVNADSSSYTTYHLHSTTSTTATTTDYNTSLNTPDISNVMGGCYTEAVYHHHNSTTRCTGTFRFYCYGNADCDSHVVMRNIFKCDVCGAKNWYWKNGETNIDDDLPQSWTGPCTNTVASCVNVCGKSNGQALSYTVKINKYYQNVNGVGYTLGETSIFFLYKNNF